MGNQSAEAITSFRRNLQSSTRQAAKDPAKLKQIIYKLKNEWVRIMDAYPEVGDVGNAQYLRALLKPGAMQYSGEAAPQYLRTLVETLGWVEKELRTKDKSAKAVVAAAKANGVKRVPFPSDAVMWEQWIPKYRRRVEGLLEAPYPKDVKGYAQTLLDLAVRHMGDVPHEKSMMVQAARHLFTALSALQKDNTEAGKQSIWRAALILRGLETGM